MPKRRAVFLDRDGVLNRAVLRDGKPYPPASAAELEILPGVEQACAELHDRGFLLIGATNQPDIARGTQTREAVDEINHRLCMALPLETVAVCPHDDADECACRKPAPGLLLQAAANMNIDLASSWMAGDRWRDIEAGRRAGCRTVWLRYGYREREPECPDLTVSSLLEAVPWILEAKEQ